MLLLQMPFQMMIVEISSVTKFAKKSSLVFARKSEMRVHSLPGFVGLAASVARK